MSVTRVPTAHRQDQLTSNGGPLPGASQQDAQNGNSKNPISGTHSIGQRALEQLARIDIFAVVLYLILVLLWNLNYIILYPAITSRTGSLQRRSQSCADRSQECGFRGQSDYYGLGQRIAIYIQLFATCFSAAVVREALPVMQSGLAIFTMATTFTYFVQVVRGQVCTFAAEVAIMLLLLGANYNSGLLFTLWGGLQDAEKESYSKIHGSFFAAFLGSRIFFVLELWFWKNLAFPTKGSGDFELAPTPCGTTIVYVIQPFLVLSMNPSRDRVITILLAVRYFWQCLAETLAATATALQNTNCPKSANVVRRLSSLQGDSVDLVWMVVSRILGFVGRWCASLMGREAEYRAKTAPFNDEEHVTHTNYRWFANLMKMLLMNVCYIVSIELTLQRNHVGEVQSLDTTGQLLTFLSGISAIIIIAWKWIKKTPEAIGNVAAFQNPDGTWR